LYLDGLVAVRLVTLEGSGVLLHDGVLLKRSDHFLRDQTRKKIKESKNDEFPCLRHDDGWIGKWENRDGWIDLGDATVILIPIVWLQS